MTKPLHPPAEDCDGGPACPWYADHTHDDPAPSCAVPAVRPTPHDVDRDV